MTWLQCNVLRVLDARGGKGGDEASGRHQLIACCWDGWCLSWASWSWRRPGTAAGRPEDGSWTRTVWNEHISLFNTMLEGRRGGSWTISLKWTHQFIQHHVGGRRGGSWTITVWNIHTSSFNTMGGGGGGGGGGRGSWTINLKPATHQLIQHHVGGEVGWGSWSRTVWNEHTSLFNTMLERRTLNHYSLKPTTHQLIQYRVGGEVGWVGSLWDLGGGGGSWTRTVWNEHTSLFKTPPTWCWISWCVAHFRQ